MSNGALRDWSRLARHHYVIGASSSTNYWADFSFQGLKEYIARYGRDFCLILSGTRSDTGDFYAIPFAAVHHVFAEKSLVEGARVRWVVDVRSEALHVRNCLDVRPVHDYCGKWPDEVLSEERPRNAGWGVPTPGQVSTAPGHA